MNGIPSYKSTGCGCGSGAPSAASCGCGGSECASCQGQEIVRPRFFAGQLLTEDDLQLLTDYVGNKNRLHNRHLYGAGVVCGLEVTCHPCGDGRVIVHPGYALDCCGNDLTLACAQTLDINAMVRDLRRDQLGGYDCGDPCPDPGADATIKPKQDPAIGSAQQGGVVPPPPQAFRYCLYVRYREQSSDPVMPYSTGEDCGRLACEPTRVREGVRFELRCRPKGSDANPLIERLCAFVGDINQFRRVLEALDRLDSRTVLAQAALVKDHAGFSEGDIVRFKDVDQNLQSQLILLKSQRSSSGRVSSTLIESVRDAAMLTYRYNALPQEKREPLQGKDPALSNRVAQIKDNLSQAVAAAAADTAVHFNVVRDWLLERLGNAPFLTDCTLRQKVYAMILPDYKQGSPNQAQLIADGNRQLIEAFVNFLRDCVSLVMNPACLPCDDAGVLLACLEVDNCNVVKVCNLERTFVLSPAAVRYWLPPLQLLGNLIERLCCDPLESLLKRTDGKSNLNVDLDMGKLLTEEVKRILENSHCVGGSAQLNPLTTMFDQVLRSRQQGSAPPSKIEQSDPAKGRDGGSVGKEFAPSLKETASTEAATEQPQPADEATEVKAPAPATKKAKTSSVKKADKKTVNETAAATPAETPEGAGAKTNGAKTNGAKTNGGEGEQK